MQMVEDLPGSDAEFLNISGVSDKKLAAYGETFLAVISEHAELLRIPEGMSATSMISLRAKLAGRSVSEIAAERELTETTVLGHLARAIRHRLLTLEQVVDLSAEDRKAIETALIDQDALTEQASIKPVYEQLGEQYSYGDIRCVQAALQAS